MDSYYKHSIYFSIYDSQNYIIISQNIYCVWCEFVRYHTTFGKGYRVLTNTLYFFFIFGISLLVKHWCLSFVPWDVRSLDKSVINYKKVEHKLLMVFNQKNTLIHYTMLEFWFSRCNITLLVGNNSNWQRESLNCFIWQLRKSPDNPEALQQVH